MKQETKKELKARLTNEIAARFKNRITSLEHRCNTLGAMYHNETLKVQQLKQENLELKDKVEQYEDWINRLQEFMDMDPELRENAITQYKVQSQTSEKLNKIVSMYQGLFYHL